MVKKQKDADIDLEKQIKKEFSKFDVFSSVRKFTRESLKIQDCLQSGDSLIMRKGEVPAGTGGLHDPYTNGLRLYLKVKESPKPVLILETTSYGEIEMRNGFYESYAILANNRKKNKVRLPNDINRLSIE
jgi:hypothetical protein